MRYHICGNISIKIRGSKHLWHPDPINQIPRCKQRGYQTCRAAGYLAAAAKCLQAATWLVARGNKIRKAESMAIIIKDNVFTLQTKNSTYQMKADSKGVLLHTYYGKKTDETLSLIHI